MAEDLMLISLFEDSFPEEWRRDPDFTRYLNDLTSFTKARLIREPALIKEEQECVLNSTQKLAFNNYSTFIQTAECSRDIFQEFINVESHVDLLVDKIPHFSSACKQFGKQAQEISSKRKLNSLALSKHTQLLEILEIPQLMETCVRNGYYEEALELSSHVCRMVKKHSNILIVKNIGNDTDRYRQLMLTQLVQQLQGSLVLPVCLRLVGLLRRMNVFTETELRLKFLQARDHWLQSVLSSIPKDDSYLHISKTIDSCRVHLFDIVTQYKALFPDDDSILAGIHGNTKRQSDGTLFCGWLNSKIWQFLSLLESDLYRGVGNRMDSLLSQCMYFGLSFSRVGADFRPLIMPVFIKVSLTTFQHSLRNAKHQFHEAMKHFTLTQSIPSSYMTSSLPLSSSSSLSTTFLSPPHSLVSYPPLELLTNCLIASFNTLRTCAPLALAPEVTREIDRLLQSVIHDIGEFHRVEYGSFTKSEMQAFKQLCRVIILDFLPFFEKCVSVFFPKDKVLSIASSVVLSNSHKEHNDSSATIKPVILIGINARTLAEPLRVLVPELFDEIEKEEMLKSMSALQVLLEEQKEPVGDTGEHPLSEDVTSVIVPDINKKEDDTEVATPTNDIDTEPTPTNDNGEETSCNEVITITTTDNDNTTTAATGGGGGGWENDFTFDNDDKS